MEKATDRESEKGRNRHKTRLQPPYLATGKPKSNEPYSSSAPAKQHTATHMELSGRLRPNEVSRARTGQIS